MSSTAVMFWPHGQPCQIGYYDGNGRLTADRDADDQDRIDLYEGRLRYDPETHPGARAWREHVERGGD